MEVLRLDSEIEWRPPNAEGMRIEGSKSERVFWHLAEECAVAFLINGKSFAVMMATPTDLEDFAVGFLLSERIIASPADLIELRMIPVVDGVALNCIVTDAAASKASRSRTLTGRSGCGLCGTETLGAALPDLRPVTGPSPSADQVHAAFGSLADMQPLNTINHSTHAAAFFSLDGTVALAREDVGRHNALDKLGGAMLRQGIDPKGGFIVLSSRMSVEMVQKAVMFRVPFLASLSAPTDLAVRAAARFGLAIAARSGDGVVFFDRVDPP